MTIFTLIEPATKTVRNVERDNIDAALRCIDLKAGEVDHAMITKHLGIVVEQYGMFKPPSDQAYTAIAGVLFAGNALVYGVGDMGETVDGMDAHALATACIFLPDGDHVERAISKGLVMRPCMTLNGQTIWLWPAPRPKGFGP